MRARVSKGRLALVTFAALVLFSLPVAAAHIDDITGLNPLAAAPDDPQAGPDAFLKPPIPELTQEERADAVSIATNDVTVKGLIANQAYSIGDVGVWHTDDLRKIGAAIMVTLPDPISVDQDLPAVKAITTLSVPPSVQQTVSHVTAAARQRLVILVEFGNGKVVQITPVPGEPLDSPATSTQVSTP